MSKIVGPLINRLDFTQAEVQENCIIRKPEGINRAEIDKLIQERLKVFGTPWVKKRPDVGDICIFGNYPQGARGEVKPIEWRVLAVEGNKALIISRYGLDCQQFHKDRSTNKWKDCTLHSWLNEDFYRRAFNGEEQKKIQQSPLKDAGTTDKVFLLSKDEAEKYFTDDNDRRCAPTAYAVAQGADQDNEYTTTDGADCCFWWLRSPSYDSDCASGVYYAGDVLANDYVDQGDDTIRPALWVNIS